MSDRESNSFVWFIAGLGLGALAGVLYAPRPGSETRDVLRSRAEEGRDYVRSRARDARSQASEWVDRGRDVVSQQKEQFRAAYEAGRQAYQEATTETGAPKSLQISWSRRSGSGERFMENLTPLFIALTGAAVVLQAGILAALYLAMRKSSARMEAL